ncbi:hypothetical protein IFM46972_07713 [Aspergillus udagawae]|uniref:Uncharacterized protein n=1 Tax=Aspergillus udagawae TaxID=91492 RepID=A0A8H3PB60_9EURO|nr:hypothetical protein IFM46972_07713 [Aspergillus udagawae]
MSSTLLLTPSAPPTLAFGKNMLGVPLITRYEVKAVTESVSKQTSQEAAGAHVNLAWSQVDGHSVFQMSVMLSCIRDNEEFGLTSEEVQQTSAIGKVWRRYNDPLTDSPRWNISGFGEPGEQSVGHQVVL